MSALALAQDAKLKIDGIIASETEILVTLATEPYITAQRQGRIDGLRLAKGEIDEALKNMSAA